MSEPQLGEQTGSGEQRPLCSSCRRRPAAYVLDRLAGIGQTLSTLSAVTFPVWACENCVQHLLGQVLDAAPVASVCRIESYQQARAFL
jgi:hypothetical protein